MVALDMVEQRFSRNVEDDVLQFLQIAHTSHFFQGIRIAEDEIAEMMKRKNVSAVREFTQEDINTLIAFGMEKARRNGQTV